jgi:hypothetical protein
LTVYIDSASRGQFDAYRSHRNGPARNVTHIADSTTLAAEAGSGHTIVMLCGYHSRGDSGLVEAQIKTMVDSGRATIRQDPVGG